MKRYYLSPNAGKNVDVYKRIFMCRTIYQSDSVENKLLGSLQPTKSESRTGFSLFKPRGSTTYE
jgi:hypothetical protein